jgi:copper chaperone
VAARRHRRLGGDSPAAGRHLTPVHQPEGQMQQLELSITGMTCNGCVNSVRNALSRVPGVRDAEVTIGAATVTFDPAVANAEAIRGAITKAGFALAAA